MPNTRTLIAGWFSFTDGHATAGDLLSAQLLGEWLGSLGHACDFATAPPFTGGVDWRAADPAAYEDVFFVCGPWARGHHELAFVHHFRSARLIGVNLSLAGPEEWNPFDLLLERDSAARVRPDLVFASTAPLVPVVGVCQLEGQPGLHTRRAKKAIDALTAAGGMTRVDIDTRLDMNATGLRTAAEVESMIARMDVVVTTRLHGLALALKHGIPAIAIDVVPGGGKLTRQARAVEWPAVLAADTLDGDELRTSYEWALTGAARGAAAHSARLAREGASMIRNELRDGLFDDRTDSRRASRLADPVAAPPHPPAPPPMHSRVLTLSRRQAGRWRDAVRSTLLAMLGPAPRPGPVTLSRVPVRPTSPRGDEAS